MSGITSYVQAATLLYLSDPVNGFNSVMAGLAGSYGIQPITIDWTPAGMQYVPAYLTPDDVDESSPVKYPMVFLHGLGSRNAHLSRGRKFSGPVSLRLAFWMDHKASRASVAGPALESMCSAVEETCNNLFWNGNWPQLYGAGNAVCDPPASLRTPLEQAAKMWRQGTIYDLVFTLDTN